MKSWALPLSLKFKKYGSVTYCRTCNCRRILKMDGAGRIGQTGWHSDLEARGAVAILDAKTSET